MMPIITMRLRVAWYDRKNWELLKQTADDADQLEDSYWDFLVQGQEKIDYISKIAEAEAVKHRIMYDVQKEIFDVAAFNRWCTMNGRRKDQDSRTYYIENILKPNRGG